eukprot:jgi/Botrbrau1/17799/Bobra.0127s0048.1
MLRSIPVIDISNFEERRADVTREILHAAAEVGFLQVINHAIPQQHIDDMFAMSEAFFSLEDSVKANYPLDKAENRGWEKLGQVRPSTGVADPKESMQVGFNKMEGKWPSDSVCPGFRSCAETFMQDCHSLSMKLLSCFAEGLGFDRDFFSGHHDPSREDCQQALRLLHYLDSSGKDFPPGTMRAGAHTDFDTLTLLFQRPGQGGLEVCPGREAVTVFASGDEWTPLEPREGAICINIGDMLMQWSDDKFKSTFHRVRAPRPGDYTGPRYSIAFFNQVNKASVIAGPGGKYPAVTGEEFMRAAMKRNYDAIEAIKLYKASGLVGASSQPEVAA